MNEAKKALAVYANIRKHVRDSQYECVCEGCKEKAINSHLLQRNGILSRVFENGHMYEPKLTDILNNSFANKHFEFKKIGVSNALSTKLFCNKHDTELFKKIEDESPVFDDYNSHLLLSYRTTCAEKRKKEMEIEICTRALNSETFKYQFSYLNEFKDDKDGLTKGVKDLNYYLSMMESELKSPDSKFVFMQRTFPISGIYASGLFSLTDHYIEIADEDTPLHFFIIHIVPVDKGSKIIIGFCKDHIQSWAKDYLHKFECINDSNIEEYITSILIRTNGWGISPEVYNNIDIKKATDFFIKFEDDIYTIDSKPYDKFNIFDGALFKAYKTRNIV